MGRAKNTAMAISIKEVQIFSSKGGFRVEMILWASLRWEPDLNGQLESRCIIGGIG